MGLHDEWRAEQSKKAKSRALASCIHQLTHSYSTLAWIALTAHSVVRSGRLHLVLD